MGALKVYTENGWEQVQTGGTSAEIPTALPNPHKLTFSGAVEAEYDGSEPVEVVIPEGGGGGIPLPPTAEVGQFFKVSAVENGKVTAVEAVNMASGGEGEASEFELVVDVTTEEVVQTLEFPFTNQNVKEIFVFVKPAASFAPNNAFFSIEGESQIVFRFAHINSLTIGKTGMFVNAKFAGEMVFSTLCLKADYMWNSDKQYASEYERQNEAEDITKIVLDFYADVPVGTVIRVYAR